MKVPKAKFRIFNILVIILYINLINSQSNEPCKYEDFDYEIKECRNEKTNIIFSIKNPCDITHKDSKKLPKLKLDTPCKSCLSGEYLTYNFKSNKQECKKCPENTYSPGSNFFVRGDYREWKDKSLINQFKNYCFIKDTFTQIESEDCTAFEVSNEGTYISSNKGSYKNIYEYTSVLSLNLNLNKKGKIHFKYQKDSAQNGSSVVGLFRFYVNYLIEYEDYNHNKELPSSKWTDVEFELEPGYYTFLWQYSKDIIHEKYNDLQLKISDIEISGVDNNKILSCKPCLYGNSEQGSDHCDLCKEDFFYDLNAKMCAKCPEGKTSPANSIGPESCQKIRDCTIKDYILKSSGLCNKESNKEKAEFVLIKGTKCKEGNMPNFEKEVAVNCKVCPEGMYQKEQDGYTSCAYCGEEEYSQNKGDVSCSKCVGILSKIAYIVPEDIYNYASDFEVYEEEAEVKIYVRRISKEFERNDDDSPNENIQILLNNVEYQLLELIDNFYTITLAKGKYNLQVSMKNLNIGLEKIIIRNSNLGGGYKCSTCASGFLQKDSTNRYICKECEPGNFVNNENNCVPCPEFTYKSNSNIHEKCISCPIFSRSNKDRTGCVISNYLEVPYYKFKYSIKNFNDNQEVLCQTTSNLCHDSFYGPIKDVRNNNLYFVSFTKNNYFQSSDFSFDEQNKNDLGYIFMLVPSGQRNENEETTKNLKSKVNLGRDIDFIRMIYTKKDRGVLIRYINGDQCKEDHSKKYSTYLYLKCSKSSDEFMNNYQTPKLVGDENCVKYLEWSSPNGCPYCLASEIRKSKLACRNTTRYIINNPNSQCIIDNESEERPFASDVKSTVIFKLSQPERFQEIYHIDFNIQGVSRKKKEKYITSKKISEVCSKYEDFDRDVIIAVIAIPCVYLIIVILCLIFCCKYRRISGDYMKLMEDPKGLGSNTLDIEAQGDEEKHEEEQQNKKEEEEEKSEELDKEDVEKK